MSFFLALDLNEEETAMARKSRYIDYAKGLQKLQKKEKISTPSSVLAKLKQLKGQEFSMNVPIGGADGK